MSTHYLVDAHASNLAQARILDVLNSPNGESVMDGGFVVRVPDYIAVKDPMGLLDPSVGLLAKKYAGLLAYYAGFQYVTWDDFLDDLGVDYADPALKGSFGHRSHVVLPPGGVFVSVPVSLTGPVPSQGFVTWEAFSVEITGTPDTRLSRVYREEPASGFTCQVSFDGGAHYYAAQDAVVVNIPPVGQGSSFIVRLTNVSPNPLHLGSWAVVY